MKNRFSYGGDGREWRKGRFRLLGLAAPREEDSYYSRDQWGTIAANLGGLPEHLSGDFVRVPEGLGLTARCHGCGGRHEGLIDFRAAARADDSYGMLDVGTFAAIAPLEEWVPQHRGCHENPRQHHTPALVHDFLASAEETARALISVGQRVPGVIYILETSGRVYCIRIDDLPERSPFDCERDNEIAARHCAIREMVRARKLDLLAAAVVSEGWLAEAALLPNRGIPDDLLYPSRSPARKEVLMVEFVTPTFGRAGFGHILRQGGRTDEGPGTIAAIGWSPGGPSALLDTVLATTDVLPQSEEQKQRGAGFVISRVLR